MSSKGQPALFVFDGQQQHKGKFSLAHKHRSMMYMGCGGKRSKFTYVGGWYARNRSEDGGGTTSSSTSQNQLHFC
jgi:hypothetical protein